MRSLSPLHRIGDQVAEVLRSAPQHGARAANAGFLQQFEKVGFADPLRAWRSYPFEMFGGSANVQCRNGNGPPNPKLLIADEPDDALRDDARQVLG